MQNLFSHPLNLEDMGSGVRTYRLSAEPKQLAYIAEVLKVDGVLNFTAMWNKPASSAWRSLPNIMHLNFPCFLIPS